MPDDNCHGCSLTIPRMVTHQPKDCHPPEGSYTTDPPISSQIQKSLNFIQGGHQHFSKKSEIQKSLNHPRGWGWSGLIGNFSPFFFVYFFYAFPNTIYVRQS